MRVLVADDDFANRRLLEVTLTKWGYDVVLASDGDQAWEVLEREDAPPLAILDWMMPGMDGVDICRKVREAADPRMLYVILLTTKDQREDVVTGLEAGADDYITKPFDRDELLARIRVGERMIGLQERIVEQARVLEAERHQAEHLRVLMLEHERFDTAVSRMSDAIVALDGDWRIKSANRAAHLLLNLPTDPASDSLFDPYLEPFTLSLPFSQVRSSAERETAFEISRPNTEPPLFLDARLTRLFDAGKLAHALLVVRDVTDERRAETLRMNFFMMVSHKLRTPLSVLIGYSELLKRMSRETMLEQWDHIHAECDHQLVRLNDTVKQLLDYKALSNQQLEAQTRPTDVPAVVEATVSKIRERYHDRLLEISTTISPDAQHIDVREDHLAQVLERLLENSAKFGDKEVTRVTINVERQWPSWIRFAVTDNGTGIPHEYYDRIFEGFIQVEDRTTGQVPGLGVGLFTVKEIVRAYGGEIAVQSRMGEGSTITFTLPEER